MAQALRVLRPVPILPEHILATNVPDTDVNAWVSGTTYSIDDQVKVGYKVYRSLIDTNTGNDPTAPANIKKWSQSGVINRMRPFDEKLSTKTKQSTSITYTIKPPSAITALVLKGVTGATDATVKMIEDGSVIYNRSERMYGVPAESGLWYWLFGAKEEVADANYFNMPTSLTATVEVTIDGSADLAVGVIAMGNIKDYGRYVLQGSSAGVENFAINGYDEWQEPVRTELSWAKTATLDLMLRQSDVDSMQKMIAKAGFSPSIWIGSEKYEALNIYGYVENFDMTINWGDVHSARLTIKGMPE